MLPGAAEAVRARVVDREQRASVIRGADEIADPLVAGDQPEVDLVAPAAEAEDARMPARRGDLLAHDAAAVPRTSTASSWWVVLLWSVITTKSWPASRARRHSGRRVLRRRCGACAGVTPPLNQAGPERSGPVGQRGERGHGQGSGTEDVSVVMSDVHAGRADLVESEQHVPLPAGAWPGQYPRAGRRSCPTRDRGRRPAAHPRGRPGRRDRASRLEQAEVHDVRASRLVVGIRRR